MKQKEKKRKGKKKSEKRGREKVYSYIKYIYML